MRSLEIRERITLKLAFGLGSLPQTSVVLVSLTSRYNSEMLIVTLMRGHKSKDASNIVSANVLITPG
jgi:phosphomannomutase